MTIGPSVAHGQIGGGLKSGVPPSQITWTHKITTVEHDAMEAFFTADKQEYFQRGRDRTVGLAGIKLLTGSRIVPTREKLNKYRRAQDRLAKKYGIAPKEDKEMRATVYPKDYRKLDRHPLRPGPDVHMMLNGYLPNPTMNLPAAETDEKKVEAFQKQLEEMREEFAREIKSTSFMASETPYETETSDNWVERYAEMAGKPLRHDLNEVFVMHVTKRGSDVDSIAKNGLRTCHGKLGIMGANTVYFADDIAKSSQYADSSEQLQEADLKGIKGYFPDSSIEKWIGKNGICFAFVFRVTLGNYYTHWQYSGGKPDFLDDYWRRGKGANQGPLAKNATKNEAGNAKWDAMHYPANTDMHKEKFEEKKATYVIPQAPRDEADLQARQAWLQDDRVREMMSVDKELSAEGFTADDKITAAELERIEADRTKMLNHFAEFIVRDGDGDLTMPEFVIAYQELPVGDPVSAPTLAPMEPFWGGVRTHVNHWLKPENSVPKFGYIFNVKRTCSAVPEDLQLVDWEHKEFTQTTVLELFEELTEYDTDALYFYSKRFGIPEHKLSCDSNGTFDKEAHKAELKRLLKRSLQKKKRAEREWTWLYIPADELSYEDKMEILKQVQKEGFEKRNLLKYIGESLRAWVPLDKLDEFLAFYKQLR